MVQIRPDRLHRLQSQARMKDMKIMKDMKKNSFLK